MQYPYPKVHNANANHRKFLTKHYVQLSQLNRILGRKYNKLLIYINLNDREQYV